MMQAPRRGPPTDDGTLRRSWKHWDGVGGKRHSETFHKMIKMVIPININWIIFEINCNLTYMVTVTNHDGVTCTRPNLIQLHVPDAI